MAGGTQQNDEALMDAFAAGDARAFEQLVRRHQRGVYNFVLRSVRRPNRAEELLQEVFMRVVRSKDRYQRSAKFTTWLYSIARNLCVDESRRAKFRDHRSLDATRRGPGGEASSPIVDSLAADDVPTDEAAQAPALRKRLAAAVDNLPEDQREVFLLRQMSGMAFRDIAQCLGVRENTVKSRMRYALEKLRTELADLRAEQPIAPAEGKKAEAQTHA